MHRDSSFQSKLPFKLHSVDAVHFGVITLYPELVKTALERGLLGKAQEHKRIKVWIEDLRKHGDGKHQRVDDTPYGGGEGMVLRPDCLENALNHLKQQVVSNCSDIVFHVIALSPQGHPFSQQIVRSFSDLMTDRGSHFVDTTDMNPQLAQKKSLCMVFICGQYEGMDQRFLDRCVDTEWSLGDFVLMGGEMAALAMVEALTRAIPGVLGNPDSFKRDSFSGGCQVLKHPVYTKPVDFHGIKVPDVLLKGDHGLIDKFRKSQALEATQKKRPDLLKKQD